jgi:hypothetical protein
MDVHVLTRTETIPYEGTDTFIIGVYSSFAEAIIAKNKNMRCNATNACTSRDWNIERFIIDE